MAGDCHGAFAPRNDNGGGGMMEEKKTAPKEGAVNKDTYANALCDDGEIRKIEIKLPATESMAGSKEEYLAMRREKRCKNKSQGSTSFC